MKKIVITGGVGSGKSKVLSILKEKCNCKVVRADDVAKELMKPGKQCYLDIIDTFPEYDLLEDEGGPFDKTKLSQLVFANPGARAKINAIVHPAVKEYILEDVKSEEETGQYDYYFLETALAIEEKYNELFDETWYICKMFYCLVNGHFEYVINIFILVINFQRLFVVTSALTHFTLNINIRQKIHLNL